MTLASLVSMSTALSRLHRCFGKNHPFNRSSHRSSRRSRWSLHPQNLWSRRNLISPDITSRKRRGGFSRMPQFVFSLRFVLYDGILWFRPSRHVIEYTMLILCIFMWCIGILIFHVNQGDIDVIHGRHGIWQPDSFGGTRGHRGEKVPGPWVLCCLAMRK